MGKIFCSCVAVAVEGGCGLMEVLLLVSPSSFLFELVFVEIGEGRPTEVVGQTDEYLGKGVGKKLLIRSSYYMDAIVVTTATW